MQATSSTRAPNILRVIITYLLTFEIIVTVGDLPIPSLANHHVESQTKIYSGPLLVSVFWFFQTSPSLIKCISIQIPILSIDWGQAVLLVFRYPLSAPIHFSQFRDVWYDDVYQDWLYHLLERPIICSAIIYLQSNFSHLITALLLSHGALVDSLSIAVSFSIAIATVVINHSASHNKMR